MKFERFLSILLSVGILLMGIPLPINAEVSRQVWIEKEGMFPFYSDGSSQNVSLTLDIPNLISVTGKYTDNGVVNYSVLGNTVTVNLSGGTYYSSPVKGTATATEAFSFRTTDKTISKNVSSNRKVLEVLGHTMGSTVSSVVVDSNPNFLKFNLVPGASNKIQDNTNVLSYYDTIETNGNKVANVTIANKDYSTLPYFSMITSVETSYISNGYVSAPISADKKSVTYNFSWGTPKKEIEKQADGTPYFRSVAERGWVWLTQWFNGYERYFTTYYKDPNTNQQIIPYDTRIVPGSIFDSNLSDIKGQSIKDLLEGKTGYEDGVRRTFSVSNYVDSDWPYIAGYKLISSADNTAYNDSWYLFNVEDGSAADFYNTMAETVHYDSSGISMGIYSDVHFIDRSSETLIMGKPGSPTEDPDIEWHWQLKYGAGFSILRGRDIYNYKTLAKINYYPYTYTYSGTVTYKYETETSQTGYIYNGYIKAKYRSLETVLDQPPTAPTDIVVADKRQVSWLPATDDYTPRSSLRYNLYYKNASGAWTYFAGGLSGYAQEPPAKIQYTHNADIPPYTDGLIYLRIDAVDDAGQYASGYNDPNLKLVLTGSLNKTTAVQDETLNISASTKSTPDATGVTYSLVSNAGATSGSLTKTARIPDKTISYFFAPFSSKYQYKNVPVGYKTMTGAYQGTGTALLNSFPGSVLYSGYGGSVTLNGGNKFYGWGTNGTDESFEIGKEGTFILPWLNSQDPFRLGETSPPAPPVLGIGGHDLIMWLRPMAHYDATYDIYYPPTRIETGRYVSGSPANYLRARSDNGYIRPEYIGKYVINKSLFTGKLYPEWQYEINDIELPTYLAAPGMIFADPLKPLAFSWKDGRMKVMQPGAILYDGPMGSDCFFNIPTNRLHGIITDQVGDFSTQDGDSWDETTGDWPVYSGKAHWIGAERYTLSRTQWNLQDIDTYYNNLYAGHERDWLSSYIGSDWHLHFSVNGIQPVMDNFLPATNTWAGNITLPHNIRNGNYNIRLTAANGSSTSNLDLPIVVNTPINLTGTISSGTLEGGNTYTAEAYTSQYVDAGGVVFNIFGTNHTMAKSGAFGTYAAGKQKWTCAFTVPALQAPGNYDAESGAFAKAKFTATLPGGDTQSTSVRFNILAPFSSITGINLTGYVGDLLAITANTTGFAASAWVEIPGVPSISLTPAGAAANNTNTWTGTFAVPYNFPNGTQNIIYRSSNSRGVGTANTKTVTIGTKINVTGSVSKPAYITWASAIPAGEKLDIATTVTTLPNISKIEYITPWFAGTIPLGKKTGNTTVSSIVTPQRLPGTLADGNYSVTIRVTTVNGVTAEAILPFTVYTPVSATGDNITVPTDEYFKLGCTVTGAMPSVNSIKAALTGEFQVASGLGLNYINTTEDYVLQSPNPYPDNYENTWVISKPGANKMRVHFAYIDTEDGYDYVYIGPDWDWSISGYYTDYWSPWISGSELSVGLYSDYSYTYTGFLIDKVEYAEDTEGTLVNPEFNLTYNPITGKYESQSLKLLMSSNEGSYPITYKAATTNGNLSVSNSTLTVTTPMSLTASVLPTSIHAGGNVVISAAVNKWVKDVTVAMPHCTVSLDPALRRSNGDGTYTYTQTITIPDTTTDNFYNIKFTAAPYNNAANIEKYAMLNVFTPLNITASVSPDNLPASETVTIDAWVDTPIGINKAAYVLSGPFGGSGQLNFIEKSGNVSHYQGTYTIDARHPDGSFNVNITATLINTKTAAISKPVNIVTPVNIDPYLNGKNTGCEIYSGQPITLSAFTTHYPERFEMDILGKTYSSQAGEIRISANGVQKEWTLLLNLPENELPPDGFRGIAAYRAYLPSGRFEEAFLEYNIVGIKAYDFRISLINNVDWRGYYFDLQHPIIDNGKLTGYPRKAGTDIYTANLPVNMKPDRSGPILNHSADGHPITFVRAGTGVKGAIHVLGEPDSVKFQAVFVNSSGLQTQVIHAEANGPVYSFSWIIPLETMEDSFVSFSLVIEKDGRIYGNEKWLDTWLPGNNQRNIFYVKGNVLRDDIFFNQSN